LARLIGTGISMETAPPPSGTVQRKGVSGTDE
jgi:hypothetical protein